MSKYTSDMPEYYNKSCKLDDNTNVDDLLILIQNARIALTKTNKKLVIRRINNFISSIKQQLFIIMEELEEIHKEKMEIYKQAEINYKKEIYSKKGNKWRNINEDAKKVLSSAHKNFKDITDGASCTSEIMICSELCSATNMLTDVLEGIVEQIHHLYDIREKRELTPDEQTALDNLLLTFDVYMSEDGMYISVINSRNKIFKYKEYFRTYGNNTKYTQEYIDKVITPTKESHAIGSLLFNVRAELLK